MSYVYEEQGGGNSKLIINIISGLAIVALLGAGWWFMNKQLNKNSDVNKPEYSYTGLVRDTDPKLGNSDSDVQIVFFEDYLCGACASFHPTLVQLVEEYGDEVEMVFKPVDNLGSNDLARAVFAAANQGFFEEYTDQVFENQSKVRLSVNNELRAIAESVNGLDFEEWNNDRLRNSDIEYRAEFNDMDVRNTEFPESSLEGQRVKPTGENNILAGVTATPTTAILKGGEVVDWFESGQAFDTISTMLDTALGKEVTAADQVEELQEAIEEAQANVETVTESIETEESETGEESASY